VLAEGRASGSGRYSSDDFAGVAAIVRVQFFAARFEQVVEFAASAQAFVVFPGVGIHAARSHLESRPERLKAV